MLQTALPKNEREHLFGATIKAVHESATKRPNPAAAQREGQILAEVIRAYVAGEDAPTYRALAKAVGLASCSDAHKYVSRLLARGVVTKTLRGGVRPLLQPEPRVPRTRHQKVHMKEGALA
jgi:hypothetical protein